MDYSGSILYDKSFKILFEFIPVLGYQQPIEIHNPYNRTLVSTN